jgi:hypothetical protein
MISKHKSAQTTLFIIVALAIIGIIILFFLFRSGKIPTPTAGFEEDPNIYLENCAEDSVKEAIGLLNKQGGNIEPLLYKEFRFGEEDYSNISFLCHTSKYYTPCINQEPLLINHLEEEIKNYISPEIENCFIDWKKEMESRDYSVEILDGSIDIELEPGKVIIEVNKEISASKKEESFRQEELRVILIDKIYDLAIVAQEILSQEAEYCNFEQQGFGLFYPEFKVDKFRTSDLNTIYTINDKKSGERFRFAVRSCAISPGI